MIQRRRLDYAEATQFPTLLLKSGRVKAIQQPHRGPAYSIPQELYEKACRHNEQLTDAERDLLLSRGDVVGEALARPDSLTPEEHNEALGRPAPKVVSHNIRRATRGDLGTPNELFATVRQLWESGDLDSPRQAEIDLLRSEFWRADDPKSSVRTIKMEVPAYHQAATLLRAK